MTRRFVLTGTPGAGKTALLRRAELDGIAVVEEAATALITSRMSEDVAEPWTEPDFVLRVLALQQQRQRSAEGGAADVRLYDRSPVCTLALCYFLGRPVPPDLLAEIRRLEQERFYQRRVFFVRNLGSVEATPARRINLADALDFETVHEQVYRDNGYELVDLPAAPVAERLEIMLRVVRGSTH
jgi:predicted ATPase